MKNSDDWFTRFAMRGVFLYYDVVVTIEVTALESLVKFLSTALPNTAKLMSTSLHDDIHE